MKIFISYSHKDDKLFQELVDGLKGAHFVIPKESVWHDKLIPLTSEWDDEIRAALMAADLVLLLVSRDFMKSDYIWKKEMLPALARHDAKQCKVLPIILRPTALWEKSPFGRLQAALGGKKVDGTRLQRDKAWEIIVEGIAELAEKHVPAPVCAPAPPPSPPPSDFKGRAKEIKQLVAALSRPGGAAAITGLRGMGGVGKTTLAKRLANLQEIQALYPGPLIVVDMLGMSKTPLTPAAALLEAARAVKPDTPATDDLNQAAALFHQALSGQRKLVLLDNAPGNARLQSALPPPGCGLIVTSRTPALLPQGVEVFELDVLKMPEAVELLQDASTRKGVSKEQWEQVAEACGRLPLALRAAAAYLARYSKVTSVDDYLRMVRDPARRAKALTSPGEDDCYLSVLGLSVERLTEDDAALAARWRQLAVFPGDFDRPAAAAVWECDEDAALSDFEQLYDRALLQVDEETGRYKLHDLLRDVARHGLADDALHPAALRHAWHYVGVLREAGKLYIQGHDDVLNGLSLYDLEAHNIAGAMEWAKAQSEQDAAQVVNELPGGGPDVLRLRLASETRIKWLQAALAAARRLKDRRREGLHLGNLGVALQQKGELDAAAECQEELLLIAKELGDRKNEAYALGNLGNIYYLQEKFPQAIEKFEEALPILRGLKDRRAEGMALGNIGNAWAGLNEYGKALEYYQQNLDIAVATSYRHSEGVAHWNMALTYEALERMPEAVAAAERSLKIREEIRDPFTPTVRAALAEWRAAAAKA